MHASALVACLLRTMQSTDSWRSDGWLGCKGGMGQWIGGALLHSLPTSPPTQVLVLSSDEVQRQATNRLERAKSLLAQLHGPNLERLASMSSSGQSRAIYVRLHLLSGVLAFHRGDVRAPTYPQRPSPNGHLPCDLPCDPRQKAAYHALPGIVLFCY